MINGMVHPGLNLQGKYRTLPEPDINADPNFKPVQTSAGPRGARTNHGNLGVSLRGKLLMGRWTKSEETENSRS